MMSLENRVAVVTGAGGAMGRAIALALARHGASVVVNDVSEVVRETSDAIIADGGSAVVSLRDITSPNAASGVIQDALEAYGRIDALVHNAGLLLDSDIGGISDEDWHRVVGVNLNGPFWLTRAAWPHLCRQGYGRLVFVTSASGLFGNLGHAHYSASKAGLVGLMKATALEGDPHGVMANAVAPLAVTRQSLATAPTGSSRISARTLVGDRFDGFTPEQVAALVVVLTHEDCPETGSVFASAGGFTREIVLGVSAGGDFDVEPPEAILSRWTEVSSGPLDTPRSLREDMLLLRDRLVELRG